MYQNNKPSNPQANAVLFDFDGVIVETGKFHADAWHKTFLDQGIDVPYQLCLPAVELEDHAFVALIFEALDMTDEPSAWVLQKQSLFRRLLEEINIFPGVVELVEELAKHYPLAVVSSAWIENIELVLEKANIKKYFQTIVGKETVAAHKPAPDGYLKAASLLQVEPKNCLVFEDSPSGIRSAKTAGMRCIGVAHRENPEQLQEANWIVANLKDTQFLLSKIQRLFHSSIE